MSETDEIAGLLEVVDSEAGAHSPVDYNQVSDTAQAEGSENAEAQSSTPEPAEGTKAPEAPSNEVETKDSSTSDEGQTSTETQTADDSSKEQATLQTEITEQEVENWTATLPPPPTPYEGPVPEFDETGAVVNMNPQQYQDYIIAKASEVTRNENYQALVESRALDVAEKILPEIKTSPAIRQMVENARLASVFTNQPVDTVAAAKMVREALGIAPERLAAAKAEGANNAKASITVQKNAALETSSTQRNESSKSEKVTELESRVKKGDDTAFAELLGMWEENGLV